MGLLPEADGAAVKTNSGQQCQRVGSAWYPQLCSSVLLRPDWSPAPSPIQMYSIDDSPEDHRGPIYDTINDDNSSHSQSTYSQSSDTAYPRSTFTQSTTQNGSPPGPGGGQTNNGYAINDYDVPEGNERPGSRGNSSVGTVTINGIAV